MPYSYCNHEYACMALVFRFCNGSTKAAFEEYQRRHPYAMQTGNIPKLELSRSFQTPSWKRMFPWNWWNSWKNERTRRGAADCPNSTTLPIHRHDKFITYLACLTWGPGGCWEVNHYCKSKALCGLLAPKLLHNNPKACTSPSVKFELSDKSADA